MRRQQTITSILLCTLTLVARAQVSDSYDYITLETNRDVSQTCNGTEIRHRSETVFFYIPLHRKGKFARQTKTSSYTEYDVDSTTHELLANTNDDTRQSLVDFSRLTERINRYDRLTHDDTQQSGDIIRAETSETDSIVRFTINHLQGLDKTEQYIPLLKLTVNFTDWQEQQSFKKHNGDRPTIGDLKGITVKQAYTWKTRKTEAPQAVKIDERYTVSNVYYITEVEKKSYMRR